MLKSETADIQKTLAQYCRDGNDVNLPGITPGRLQHYRRLVLNVALGILSEAYPIAARVLGNEQWKELVERFFAEHACLNPQVWQMPRELLEYLQLSRYHINQNLPFLPDLLLLEWTEIEVHCMPDLPVAPHITCPDSRLLTSELVFNPHYKLLKLEYPVHRIHQKDFSFEKNGYFILVFRDMTHGNVQFISLSPFFAVFLDSLIQSKGATAHEVLSILISETGYQQENPGNTIIFNLMTTLQAKQFILGMT